MIRDERKPVIDTYEPTEFSYQQCVLDTLDEHGQVRIKAGQGYVVIVAPGLRLVVYPEVASCLRLGMHPDQPLCGGIDVRNDLPDLRRPLRQAHVCPPREPRYGGDSGVLRDTVVWIGQRLRTVRL